MNALQAVDLHAVDAYLARMRLVDDTHRRFYVRWIQRFLLGPGGNGRLSPRDALTAFADVLERDGKVADWQVRQACLAVELYQKHFVPSPWPLPEASPFADPDGAWPLR